MTINNFAVYIPKMSTASKLLKY